MPNWKKLITSGSNASLASLNVAGTLTLAAGSITDSGGSISFGNENLSTNGVWTIGSVAVNSGEALSAAVAGHNLSGTYDVLAKFASTDAGGYGIRLGQDGSDGVISGIGTSGLQFWTYNGSSWGTRYSISSAGNHDFQSGNITTTGTLSAGATTVTGLSLGDSERIQLGASGDFDLYHDGTDSWVYNQTGNLYIEANQLNRDIILRAGGSTEYVRLDSSASEIQLKQNTSITGTLTAKDTFDLDATTSTGAPAIRLSQAGTRRSYIQHIDSGDDFRVVSEYGTVSLWAGSGGTESKIVDVSTTGATITGSLHISGSSNALLVEGSGSTIFDIQGSQGQLFSVTDDLTGTLFSVNDISGIPILAVRDDDYVTIGTFGAEGLIVSGSKVYLSEVTGSGNVTLAGDLRIGTTSATSHGQEALRAYGSNTYPLNVHSTGVDSRIHFTTNASGTTTSDGFGIGIENDTDTVLWNRENGYMRFGTNATERLRIASDAYAIGIGTTDIESWDSTGEAVEFGGTAVFGYNQNLHLLSTAFYDGSWKYKASSLAPSRFTLSSDGFNFYTAASGTVNTGITWSERMRLTNGGALLIGTTSAVGSELLNVDGDVYVNGAVTATGDITAYYSSDERLKTNVLPIENATAKLQQIGGYAFDWIPVEGVHENEGHDIGVLAQEIEKVAPEIVVTRENGYKAVRYEKLVAILIQSNKELLKRIEALEEKLQ